MSFTPFSMRTLLTGASLSLLLAGGCSSWHGRVGGISSTKQLSNSYAPGKAFLVDEEQFETNLDDQLTFANTKPNTRDTPDAPVAHFRTAALVDEPSVSPYGIFKDPSPVTAEPANGNSPVTIYGELPSNLSELSTRPAAGESENISQVSFAAEGSDFDPNLSRDGNWIVYASTQHFKASDIYIKPVEGRAITQLTSDPGNDVMPALSPDGHRVAFASDRSGSWDVYVMNRAGGQAVQITNSSAHELHPTWSPDGKFLAYCALGEVSGKWELWVVNAVNPAVRHFIGYGLFPEWSPNGNTIAFQRSREQGDRYFSIWTINFNNSEASNPTEIASSPVAAVVNPTWSPDGQYIAFATIPNPRNAHGERPEQADIWISHIDGSSRANLTGGSFVNLSPTWAGNGQIFFVSDRSGRDNIWALRPVQAIVASGRSTDQNIAYQSENGANTTPSPQPLAPDTTSEVNLAEVDQDNN
jgi:TolB protein